MSTEHDAQLLEAASVRRRRLRGALLWGPERTRRAASDLVGRTLAGVVVAALLCAGCVGWSFLSGLLADQRAQRTAVSTPATTGAASSDAGSPDAASPVAGTRPASGRAEETAP